MGDRGREIGQRKPAAAALPAAVIGDERKAGAGSARARWRACAIFVGIFLLFLPDCTIRSIVPTSALALAMGLGGGRRVEEVVGRLESGNGEGRKKKEDRGMYGIVWYNTIPYTV
jgi:hypothetical protein